MIIVKTGGTEVELTYRKDGDLSYLVPDGITTEQSSYILHMLENNEISGFLSVRIFHEEGQTRVGYEVTGKQSLAQLYQRRGLTGEDLQQLFGQMRMAGAALREYLLSPEDILLLPECIFKDPLQGKIWFACFPGFASAGKRPGSDLAEFILRHLDHADRQAVDLGYAFFEEVEKGGGDIAGCVARMVQQMAGAVIQDQPEHKHTESELRVPRRREKTETEISLRSYKTEMDAQMVEEEDFAEDDKLLLEEEKPAKKKQKKKRRDKKRRYLMMAGGIAAAAAVFCLIVWLFALDLTQIGGLAFLFISVGWLICQTIVTSDKRKKNHWKDVQEDASEEDAFIAQLMQEVYDMDGPDPGDRGALTADEEGYGQTRILHVNADMPQIILSSQSIAYPDLKPLLSESLIGKQAREVDLVLPQHPSVSRIQAKLECLAEGIFITDMHSTNGTFVNQQRIHSRTQIHPGDTVGFAALVYTVKQMK